MEALVALVALLLLVVLAPRFGRDSRPVMRSQEQDWAVREMTWRDATWPPASRADWPKREREGVQSAGKDSTDFPILAFIDRALGPAGPGFATTADAARLERRAREATDAYWGETVWLTGRVSEPALRVVCDLLERERTATPEPAKTPGAAGTAIRPPAASDGPGPLDRTNRREGNAQPQPPVPAVAILPPAAIPA